MMVTIEDILRIVEEGDLQVSASKLDPAVPLVNQGFDSLDVATLMLKQHAIQKEHLSLLLSGFGVGFSWGTCLVELRD